MTNLRNKDLSGYDFSNMNLAGYDFTGSDLSGVDFSGSDLSGATLKRCKLEGEYMLDAQIVSQLRANPDVSDAQIAMAINNSKYL